MKKLFFAFALMGIVSSAHADEYDNFLQCVQAFHNDQNVINILNDGNPDAPDAQFRGIKEIVKNYDTIQKQRSALSSNTVSSVVKADSSDKVASAARAATRGFEITYASLLAFHVADKCPKYFMGFLGHYSTENRKIPDELALRMVVKEVDGKRQIRFATQKDWEKTADKDKLQGSLTIGMDPNFSGEFYMLILPKTLNKERGEWLSYAEGQEALRDYAGGYCGRGWYAENYAGEQTEYFVDLIDHVNIYKSFPGLLVPWGDNDSIVVRDNNHGLHGGKAEYIGVNNYGRDHEVRVGSIASIIEQSRAFQQMLHNPHCDKTDDFVIYAASPYHPMYIVNERFGKAFSEVTKEEKEQESIMGLEAGTVKDGAAVVGFGVAGGIVAYYGLKALGIKMGLTSAATAAGTTGGAAAVTTAGGFAVGSLATIIGIVGGLWGVLDTVGNAFEEMEEPLPVQGYNKMYIYYKTPLKDFKLDDLQYNELYDLLKKEEVQTTSSSSGSLALPVGNAGTPVKSEKPKQKIIDGWDY